jgi:uncharacterized protein YjbI with pentapeptide repeats
LSFKVDGNLVKAVAIIVAVFSVTASVATAQQQGSAEQNAGSWGQDPKLPDAPQNEFESRFSRALGEVFEENLAANTAARRNFAGAELTQASFVGRSLQSANFNAATLDWANFTGADLTGSSFVNADLTSTIFDNANLTDVDFSGANMAGAYIRGANLTGARLSRVQNIATINMSEATIYCRTIGYNDEVFSYSCPAE